jgi:hypothetical protein
MIIDCQAERLSDDRLLRQVRDAIAAASRRPALKPQLRQLLADALTEERCEDLCQPGACIDLPPEEILRVATVPVEPRPLARDTLRLLERAE